MTLNISTTESTFILLDTNNMKTTSFHGVSVMHISKSGKYTSLIDKSILVDDFVGISDDGLFEAYENPDDNNAIYIRFIGNGEIKPDRDENVIKSPYHSQNKELVISDKLTKIKSIKPKTTKKATKPKTTKKATKSIEDKNLKLANPDGLFEYQFLEDKFGNTHKFLVFKLSTISVDPISLLKNNPGYLPISHLTNNPHQPPGIFYGYILKNNDIAFMKNIFDFDGRKTIDHFTFGVSKGDKNDMGDSLFPKKIIYYIPPNKLSIDFDSIIDINDIIHNVIILKTSELVPESMRRERKNNKKLPLTAEELKLNSILSKKIYHPIANLINPGLATKTESKTKPIAYFNENKDMVFLEKDFMESGITTIGDFEFLISEIIGDDDEVTRIINSTSHSLDHTRKQFIPDKEFSRMARGIEKNFDN